MTKPMRDSDRTKAAILRAAQAAFSTRGYSAAGVREITAEAGVNPALVSRYFGSKEGLFEAALSELLDISMLTDQPREGFGKALVASFVSSGNDHINPLQMLALATADPGARAIADRLLRDLTIKPLAQWFDQPHAEERAARLVILASGFFMYRLLYPLEPLTGSMAPASRAWLETAFQSLVDDPA
jgi:AcrR family transcriptional regulator